MATGMQSFRSISQNLEYYAEAFSVFTRRSSKYEVLSAWVEMFFPPMVVEKLPTIAEKGPVEKLRIAGIGSGTGHTDCEMMKQLLKKFRSISNTVIEPTRSLIVKYKKLVEDESFNNVEFDWRQQTWDEFNNECEQTAKSEKFHFISAIHSLYYIRDLETTILDLISCLEDGGTLLMILLSDKSGTWRLWTRFPMLPDDHCKRFSSGSIRRILEKYNIKYEVMTQEAIVDITCCFEEGNEEGRLLTDFLNHVERFQETATKSFKEEVLAYMREEDCSIQEGDKILHNNDWQAIIVNK